MIKEIPMIFNSAMVRAILSGQKTQTRRIAKPFPPAGQSTIDEGFKPTVFINNACNKKWQWQKGAWFSGHIHNLPCQPGDRIYVREAWSNWYYDDAAKAQKYWYRADYADDHDPDGWDNSPSTKDRWYPSIHMPKTAARIWLEVVSVSAQRIQEITPEDAWNEGFSCSCLHPIPQCAGNVSAFAATWENTYHNWLANPWVWRIEFKKFKLMES